jgi:hypothetical protein
MASGVDPPRNADQWPRSIAGTFVPVPKATVEAVELDGQALLLDELSGNVVELDKVATLVWACFDGCSSIDELVADLSSEFLSDPDRVRSDVIALSIELGRHGMLEGFAE